MRLYIRREDIGGSTPRDARNCPIARALKRRLNASRVHVQKHRVIFGSPTRKRILYPANSARRMIDRFDRLDAVTPGYVYLSKEKRPMYAA